MERLVLVVGSSGSILAPERLVPGMMVEQNTLDPGAGPRRSSFEKHMSTTTRIVLKVQTLTEDQQRQVLKFIEQLPSASHESRVELFGLFKGHDTTEQEIAEARREMWGNFPRETF